MLYGLCVLVLALQVSAIATTYWSVKSQNSLNLHLGLWKFCAEGDKSDLSGCKHLPPDNNSSFPKNSLYAARVFAILGAALVFCALMCSMFVKLSKDCQTMCLIAGGLSSLIAMSIWAAEMLKISIDSSLEIKFNPGYSFYLNMVGGVCALITAYVNFRS